MLNQFNKLSKILFIFLVCLLCTACNKNSSQEFTIKQLDNNINYQEQTVILDNREYKQILTGEVPSKKELKLKENQSLILSMTGNPKTFNYWASNDATSHALAGVMYTGLLETNAYTGNKLPLLAKEYKLENNGKKIIITLRQGLKWSDNKPITADDVIFTWNNIIKNSLETSGTRESVLVNNKFPNIYSPDKYTIIFETNDVFAPFLGSLSYPIAPKHYFAPHLKNKSLSEQKKIFASLMGTSGDINSFVTSGAYKLTKYTPYERIEYKQNPNYFILDKEGNKLPYFKKLIYKVLNSSDLELFKFSAGEFPLLSITGDKLPLFRKIKPKKDFIIYDLGTSNSTSFVSFNLSNQGIPAKPVSTWFADKYFRQALRMSINRQAMIDTIYLGSANPLCLNTSENALYFNKELHNTQCHTNPRLEQAKELLKSHGYKYRVGKLYDKNNNHIAFKLYTNASSITDTISPRELLAESIKKQWKDLGITVDLKIIEFNNLVGRITQTRDWEAMILGLTGGDLLEPHGGANVHLSNGRLHLYNLRKPEDKNNKPLNWEKQIDNLVWAGTKHTEYSQRKNNYHKIQEIMWEQSPMIYLVSPSSFVAVNNNLVNFEPTKLGGISHNRDQWYFK